MSQVDGLQLSDLRGHILEGIALEVPDVGLGLEQALPGELVQSEHLEHLYLIILNRVLSPLILGVPTQLLIVVFGEETHLFGKVIKLTLS